LAESAGKEDPVELDPAETGLPASPKLAFSAEARFPLRRFRRIARFGAPKSAISVEARKSAAEIGSRHFRLQSPSRRRRSFLAFVIECFVVLCHCYLN